ncbi:MAG: hypothetical protein PSX80_10540 [bacterium]|nr:hypothetical protein [bacterium]
MSVLNGSDSSATRLVEAVAGSSGSIIDPTSATGHLPVLGSLDSTGDTPVATPQESAVTDSNGGLLDILSSLSSGAGVAEPIPSLPGLALAGEGTLIQPVFDAANSAIKEFHLELETLSHQTGTNDVIHSVTTLGETVGLGEIGIAPAPDGPTNLATDVLNLPVDLLSGNLGGIISNLGHDLTDVIGNVMGVKDALIFGNDPINPLPELVQSIGHDLSSLPILSLREGNGLLDGLVGDLSRSSTGHLVDVNVGPEQETGGLPINLLAANEPGPSHTLDVNAIDVGPTGPHLAALDLLTGSGLNTGGGDSLNGNLLGLGVVSAPSNATTASLGLTAPQLGDLTSLDTGAIANADHGILNLHGVHLI